MDKIIFHIDVNSAFLSWSALEKLHSGAEVDLRTIPSVIGGDMAKRHGVVLAKSIPAKSYGIVTGEPIVNAMRKCPNLTLEPPDHALYKRRSRELMTLLSDFCPDIEQVSVDECYMDYTPIHRQYSSPEEAAHLIKDQVLEELGFTVNVGISDRKVLAKMASDFKKPNLVHTLYASEIQSKLWPLPVSSLFMCGHSSVETLRKLEILTIGDLARADRAVLQAHLKSHGDLLWEYANGIDSSEVTTEQAEAKGVGNSTTLSQDAADRETAHRVLLSWPSPWQEGCANPARWPAWSAPKSNTTPSRKYPIRPRCSHLPTRPMPYTRPHAVFSMRSGTVPRSACWVSVLRS